jgi:hypothetical protein
MFESVLTARVRRYSSQAVALPSWDERHGLRCQDGYLKLTVL